MIVYKTRVFQVEEARVQFPDGRERDIAVVRHVPVVVLIPLPAPGQVILVRQYRASIARETWELESRRPAGRAKRRSRSCLTSWNGSARGSRVPATATR
jgi:hypothetical protein